MGVTPTSKRSFTVSWVYRPLLPAADITDVVADIQEHVNDDSPHANRLRQLISYVRRQWTNKRFVGPERLWEHDNHSHTNNVLESYHAALRRRINVSHPNLYSFLGHLQQITTDQMSDVARIRNVDRRIRSTCWTISASRRACPDSVVAPTLECSFCRLWAIPWAHTQRRCAQQKIEAAAATRRRKLGFQQWQRQRTLSFTTTHSCVVHPCFFVQTCPLSRFPPLHIWPCDVVHSRDFSHPLIRQCRRCVRAEWMNNK